MLNKLSKAILSLLIPVSLASCATIVHGTRQSIGFYSDPSDACVWVDNAYVGNTPVTVKMTRKDRHLVTIALNGYQPCELTFKRKVSGWFFGNFAFGGFIGLAIDAVTGGIYRLTPEQVKAQRRFENIVHSAVSDEYYIAIVLEPYAGWERIGTLETLGESF